MNVNEVKTLKEYKIKVGTKTFIFLDVSLELSPSGKWSLSYGKVRVMMKSVAAIILANKEQALTFEELEHLANTAEMSMAKIAELIQIDRSTITKWKKTKGPIPYTDSYCLKDKLSHIIFDFDDRKHDAVRRSDFWFKKGVLPRPQVA